eukprot:5116707-Pleurochrysis_carterae.AAC.1
MPAKLCVSAHAYERPGTINTERSDATRRLRSARARTEERRVQQHRLLLARQVEAFQREDKHLRIAPNPAKDGYAGRAYNRAHDRKW